MMYIAEIALIILVMDFLLSIGTPYPGIAGFIKKKIEKARYLKYLDSKANGMKEDLDKLEKALVNMESRTKVPAMLSSISRAKAQREMCRDRLEQMFEALRDGDSERAEVVYSILIDLIGRLKDEFMIMQKLTYEKDDQGGLYDTKHKHSL